MNFETLAHLRDVVQSPDLAGTRYVMEEEIGRGGNGVVYRGVDTALGRTVALKVMAAGESSEARITARLEHPGIVPVHEAGTLPDGRSYYAMRLVEGARLDEFRAGTASLPARLRVFLKILDPVAYSHSRGVIHRDLKPENIMTGKFGEVLILDWGAAKTAESSAGGAYAIGTQGFMAPEQARGVATERSDIFALGAILLWLTADLMAPKALRAIAAKASAAVAEDRYGTVEELAADVARFLDGDPVTAYRENVFERATRLANRHRFVVGLLLAYLAMRGMIFLALRR